MFVNARLVNKPTTYLASSGLCDIAIFKVRFIETVD